MKTQKNIHSGCVTCKRRYGFTLIELLVVISIIALLLSILMPALSKVKEKSKVIVCSSQSKQVGLGLAMYAQSNMDRFPVDEDDRSHWIWDVSVSILDAVMDAGATRETFYCPSNEKFNSERNWTYYVKTPPEDGDYRLIGYFLFVERGTVLVGEAQGTGHKGFLKKFTEGRASEVELMSDVVVSALPESDLPDAIFGGAGTEFRTNHMDRGDRAAGGNVLFGDTHVSWRKFDEMEMRWGQPWNMETRLYHWW